VAVAGAEAGALWSGGWRTARTAVRLTMDYGLCIGTAVQERPMNDALIGWTMRDEGLARRMRCGGGRGVARGRVRVGWLTSGASCRARGGARLAGSGSHGAVAVTWQRRPVPRMTAWPQAPITVVSMPS
jgi:hypothetical protein